MTRKYPVWISVLFAAALLAIALYATFVHASVGEPYAEKRVALNLYATPLMQLRYVLQI